MRLERLGRWHWAVIAIIVGIVAAQAQLQWVTRDPLTAGNVIEDPQRFESWLLRQTNGQWWLRDIVVHPVHGRGAAHSVQYVVTANRVYDDGGTLTLVPIAFVAPQPYKPQIDLDYLPGPAAAAAVKKLNANPNPTILDYLATVRTAAGVKYAYAWWEQPWQATAVWTAGSLLLIAGLWPTLIYLIVFGRLTQPPREKGIDLGKVRAAMPQPQSSAPTDLSALEELEREMEAQIGSMPATPGEPASSSPAPAPRVLSAVAQEVPVAAAVVESTDFGAKPDDFYPTAKVHRGKENR
jgi:hypothetical protein